MRIKAYSTGICMFKVDLRTKCEICSHLKTKTLERRHSCRSGVFIAKFKQISHLVSIVDFEHVIASWIQTLDLFFLVYFQIKS